MITAIQTPSHAYLLHDFMFCLVCEQQAHLSTHLFAEYVQAVAVLTLYRLAESHTRHLVLAKEESVSNKTSLSRNG